MKRLAKNQEPIDEYFGAYIEVINTKSKYIGYRGWIDIKYYNDKYKLMLEPEPWEEDQEHYHYYYVKINEIHKWVRLMPKQEE